MLALEQSSACGKLKKIAGSTATTVPGHRYPIGPHDHDSHPGLLVAWLRASSGQWIGICEVQLWSTNARCVITERFWLPPSAVRRRADPQL